MALNLKTWAPLAAAIVMGTIAAKIGHDMLGRSAPQKTVEVRVSRVVVAKENVTPGSALKSTDLMVTNVPEKNSPVGAMGSPEELTGRVVTVQIGKGQPVLENMLAPKGSAQGLTAIVPDGMRAVTLEINEVSGVAGLLSVGCRVDVVSTLTGENGQMLSRTIVKNLSVIAVGRKFVAPVKDAKEVIEAPEAPVARNVTLLVTPKEAEMVDLAAHTGSPRLVLRGSRDTTIDPADSGEGITLAELRGNKGKAEGQNAWSKFWASLGAAATQLQSQSAWGKATTSEVVLKPSTQPSGKPSRSVTVIRNTREASVVVDAPAPAARGPLMANTDTEQVTDTKDQGD